MRTVKTLIRLDGRPGRSESSLGAHSLCWFCHVAAQIMGSFRSLLVDFVKMLHKVVFL